MAKITWTFKNEEGTNLNRYIATNVSTGEKITFDLLRGGNISVVGTPLNAENLNALITSINACYDLINSSEKDTTYTLSKNGNAIRLTSSSGAINDVTLNKTDVGLSNVDNTSDIDKPISTATQQALNTKANKSDVYTKSETYSKTETNDLLNTKADKSTTYTKTETDDKTNKSLYNLGAFDTISGNVITRQTGYANLEDLNWNYRTESNGYVSHSLATLIKKATYDGFLSEIIILCPNVKTTFADDVYLGNIGIAVGIRGAIYYKDNNTSETTKPKGIIQYKLANPSYTEEIIEGQPLITLDSQGSQWLRDEWEKGLNLFKLRDNYEITLASKINDSEIMVFPNTSGSRKYLNLITLEKNTTYTVTTNGGDAITLSYSVNGGIVNYGNNITFTTGNTDREELYLLIDGTTANQTLWFMLVKGSHAYPYQPYNGQIVHEKKFNEIKKEFEKTIVECNCSHEVEITGFGEEDCNLAIDDQDVVITKIQGQTRRKSLNLFDKSIARTQGYLSKDGDIISNNSFSTIPPLFLKAGTYTLYNPDVWTAICEVNSSGQFVRQLRSETNSILFTFTLANDSYVRFAIQDTNQDRVMLNEGSEALPYEPYDKTLVNSKCDFVSTGRNLLPNSANRSGQNINITFDVNIEAGKTYTFSIQGGTNSGAYSIWLEMNGENVQEITSSTGAQYSKTFTATVNATKLGFYPNDINNANIMLNYGDTALPYEPYVEDTMQCGLELGAFDYHDNISHITHRQTSKMITLNGSENWYAWSTSDDSKPRFAINISEIGSNAIYKNSEVTIASTWIDRNAVETWDCMSGICMGDTSNNIGIYIEGITTVEDFKSWLQSNPITLVYKLATETTEENILPSGYKVWYKGMQVQKTDTIPYILTKQYAISLASQVLNNVSIDRSQQKQLDELKKTSENKLNASDLGGFKFEKNGNVNTMYVESDLPLISNYDTETSTQATVVGNIDSGLLLCGAQTRPKFTDGFTTSEIALSTDLDDIILRLDDLGFKEGVVYYDGVAVDSTIATIKKQGKIAILNAVCPNKSTISVPADFKPKEETSIMCGEANTGVMLSATLKIKTDGTIAVKNNTTTIITNAAWVIA